MNVAQLRIELEKLPDNMDIFIEVSNTDFAYSLLNVVEKKKIMFMEGSDSIIKANDDVIVLSDD